MMLLALTALQAVSSAKNPIPDDFTPRELYVSCSLLASGERLTEEKIGDKFKEHAPAVCAAASLKAVATANSENIGSNLKFCLKGAADVDSGILKTMAANYMRFYEENTNRLNQVSGYAALFAAMKTRWPCN